MSGERAFILGVALGVAGSLIPDLPTAIEAHREASPVLPVVYAVYAIFLIVALMILSEVS